ncbi:MAG TPA: tetratricopeptide repeat protein [Candidatus Angelobacter sp.]|nr:tetratricopeptide repeat protein [Candidatus Angelobacter sp.]
MRSIITFCLSLALPAAAGADTIVLKNGDRIYADSAQERNGRIEYSVGDNTLSIPRAIVARIDKGPAPERAPAATSTAVSEPPAMREELTIPADLAARVIRNGEVDVAALKAVEEENVPARSAAANALAANFEEKRNKFSAAARYFQAALVYQPDHSILLESYAAVLLRLGQLEEAVARARQATRVDPRSADAFLLLGYACYRSNHDREAIAALKKSLELRPDERAQELLARVERESRTEAGFHQEESSHFTLRYEGGQAPDALRRQILDALEHDYNDLSRDLSAVPGNIVIALYTDQAFFDVTQAAAWTAALNDGKIRIPISGMSSLTSALAHVLRHELTHSFVVQITHGRAPTWLNEGLAQLEEGRSAADFGPRLAALYASGHQVPLSQLEAGFQGYSSPEAAVAYAESLAATEYIRITYGPADLARILVRLGEGQSMESALRSTIHGGYVELETELTAYLTRTYGR